MCSAFRPVFPSSICVLHEKPSATTIVSSSSSRTFGSSPCSPTRIETSWCPDSKPHEPASPQQPASSVSTCTPIFSSSATSGSMPPVALWWQWPQTNALRSSGGGSTSNFAKNSAKWYVDCASRFASSSCGSSVPSSSLKTATQLG